MATQPAIEYRASRKLVAEKLQVFPKLRALAWGGRTLYAAHGYTLLSLDTRVRPFQWRRVASLHLRWWRNFTARFRLSYRLMRDGFHALSIHPSGTLIGAVPGAIVTLPPGGTEFQVTHRISRGTRPLHLTTTPDGRVYWGEYFDNPERDEVYIYVSQDKGATWSVAHTFAKQAVRHVHNIVFDRWEKCLWVFTGDYGQECKILKASLDFTSVDEAVAGNQQARAVAAIVTEAGVFFASDTPLEQNHIYFMDRKGKITQIVPIASPSIYASQNHVGMFFSTMVEPSRANPCREVHLMGSPNGSEWDRLASWQKDSWHMGLFQYGNAFLPDGVNQTDLLAVSTIAVANGDLGTTLFQVRPLEDRR